MGKKQLKKYIDNNIESPWLKKKKVSSVFANRTIGMVLNPREIVFIYKFIHKKDFIGELNPGMISIYTISIYTYGVYIYFRREHINQIL